MNLFANSKRMVIKVGTSTLTYDTGLVNIRRIEAFVRVMSDIANSGREIILVSSGAIAVGCGKLNIPQKPKDIPSRQAAAAVGQIELMHIYDTEFSKYNHNAAQVLLTMDCVGNGRRQNVINTFRRLLELRSIPIVNENDTVATDELEGDNFGDNDTLSAIVADLVDADTLILLSDIDGLFESNPRIDPDAKLIPVVEKIDEHIESIASGSGSIRGTGGMSTKIQAARIATEAGIDMAIINGSDPLLLYALLDGKQVGTRFSAKRPKEAK